MPDKKPRRKLQDPEVVRLLAASLLAGATLSEALEVVGVSESTYRRELRRTPELQSALPRTAATKPKKGKGANRSKGGRKRKAAQPTLARDLEPSARGASGRTEAGTVGDAGPHGEHEASGEPIPEQPRLPARSGGRVSRRRVAPESPTAAGRQEGLSPPSTVPSEGPSVTPNAPPAAAAAVPASDLAPPVPMPVADATSERRRLSRLVRDPYTVRGARAARARRGTRGPVPPLSGADWMPPMAVLLLQLVVGLAVGANLLVLGLIVVTCLVLFVVVIRTSRRAEPPTTEPAALAIGEDGTGDPQEQARNGRPMDLTWVASSIVKSRKPSNDRILPPPRR